MTAQGAQRLEAKPVLKAWVTVLSQKQTDTGGKQGQPAIVKHSVSCWCKWQREEWVRAL